MLENALVYKYKSKEKRDFSFLLIVLTLKGRLEDFSKDNDGEEGVFFVQRNIASSHWTFSHKHLTLFCLSSLGEMILTADMSRVPPSPFAQ